MRFILPPKTVIVSHGDFPCPNCRRVVGYKHKQRFQRRLMIFVPFLGDMIEEYIECQVCRAKHPLGVLRSGLDPEVAQILEALKEKLGSGTSIEEVESQLSNSGIDPSTVKRYVSVAAGIGLKRCPNCNLRFKGSVTKCHRCSQVLPPSDLLVPRN